MESLKYDSKSKSFSFNNKSSFGDKVLDRFLASSYGPRGAGYYGKRYGRSVGRKSANNLFGVKKKTVLGKVTGSNKRLDSIEEAKSDESKAIQDRDKRLKEIINR